MNMPPSYDWVPPYTNPARHRWDRLKLGEQIERLEAAISAANLTSLPLDDSVTIKLTANNGSTTLRPIPAKYLCTVQKVSDIDRKVVRESDIYFLPGTIVEDNRLAIRDRTPEDGHVRQSMTIETVTWVVFNRADEAYAAYQHVTTQNIGLGTLNASDVLSEQIDLTGNEISDVGDALTNRSELTVQSNVISLEAWKAQHNR